MTTPHAPRRRMKAVGATGLSATLALTLGVPATFSAATLRAPSRSKEALRAHPVTAPRVSARPAEG